MLRDMAALPHNRQCFDCHQRGPTYLNMTTGSFVCTACSGILRGINPPHRVKSISMASFTPEEIDFIKCHGNEFCRKVWLGLYDSKKDQAEPDSRDEQKIKDFMAQKYERKRWYQAPTDSMKEEARQINESATNRQPPTRQLKTLLGEKTPQLVVKNQSPQTTPKNHAAQQPPPVAQPPATQSFSSPGQHSQSSQSSGSTTMDLLGDLGGDPFASSAPPAQTQPIGGGGGEGGFADFSQFGSQFTAQPASQPFPAFQSSSSSLFPMSNTPASAAPAVNGGFASFTPAQSAAPPASTAPSEAGGDKYSSLGDLFSTPVTTESNTTALSWGGSSSNSAVNWNGGGGTSTSAGGIEWNSTGSSGSGMNWASGGTSNTMGMTSNWNSSSSANNSMAPSNSGANPFGGTSASTQPSNPFGGAGGQPSLFGNQPNAGFGQQPGGFGNQPTSAAGFGVQTSMVGGFGTPTPAVGGFGGTQTSMAGGFGAPTSMAGGFGQPASNVGSFNMGGFGQTSQAGGFGQPVGGFGGAGMTNQLNNQNGAFSSIGPTNTSAGFGAFSQAQTVPNQFGHSMPGQFDNKMGGSQGFPSGWGGQPVATNSHTVNPFMSTAAQSMAPKSGSTNPFL